MCFSMEKELLSCIDCRMQYLYELYVPLRHRYMYGRITWKRMYIESGLLRLQTEFFRTDYKLQKACELFEDITR